MKTSSRHGGSGTLVSQISSALRQKIASDGLKAGDKLPSEARIAEDFGVSRTVVREAVASLRADGLVEPRRGAGVFVLEPNMQLKSRFRVVDHARLSSVIDLIELRIAVEAEAAALAALRRSPAQEEHILDCHQRVQSCIKAREPTAQADFDLHLAIAVATNNPRFGEFLQLLGPDAIPRANLQLPADAQYLAQIYAEHEQIVAAISSRESEAARRAMAQHLKASEHRYRDLLKQN